MVFYFLFTIRCKIEVIATQKRNLLLREKWLNKSQLNEEVSNGEIYI